MEAQKDSRQGAISSFEEEDLGGRQGRRADVAERSPAPSSPFAPADGLTKHDKKTLVRHLCAL